MKIWQNAFYTRFGSWCPEAPVVCMDEIPRELIREVRKPLSMESGKPKRHDYHYERNGVVNLLYVLRAAG